MTNIHFFTSVEGKFVGFTAEGHSGYAPHGEDIVCAGISALLQTTVLGLEELVQARLEKKAQKEEGFFYCRLTMHNNGDQREKADLLLRSLYLGLTELAKEYHMYIRVSLKEVE